jgi:hypothetical protein
MVSGRKRRGMTEKREKQTKIGSGRETKGTKTISHHRYWNSDWMGLTG